ncbi:amidase signature domain-containing protein [Microdochium trichocladiopsis]|uniref:Amidase signature domain-containing protein n=1 Tax=Microdochium trichocladiopsis TaxID=1682393 RepID=A0A9P8XYF0_9PEZI|nr:amidase signature domain-containing protein [Microdochium trichocladiopsis]KAH7025098.1 amidase signature domain-containing protein [Microdochium trichocladiopsis]
MGLLLLAQHTAAHTTAQGLTIAIDNVSYHIALSSVGKLPGCHHTRPGNDDTLPFGLIPITILDVEQSECNAQGLKQLIASYIDEDDVFNEGFLQGVYLRGEVINTTALDVGNDSNIGYIRSVPAALFSAPAGPYLLSQSTGEVYVPYRLYSDTMGSFHQGVITSRDGKGFVPLGSAIAGSSAVTIGVPSRLYYKPTTERPLAGVRVGVKDIYDLTGIKTGAGSRAYYDIYPEADTNAVPVQRLIDAGAIIVGKMKTTQFAGPENVRDALDYQAPFNPRGDGYQEVGSSSSGPGSGMASYDWLDLALGSDTGGSVRVPAEDNGLFGNRPSHDMVPLNNTVPLAPQYDTAGFLARDPKLWHTACKALYSGLATSYTRLPSKVIAYELPSAGTTDLTEAQKLVLEFVGKIAKHLSASTSTFNLSAAWAQTRPAGTPENYNDMLNTTWAILAAQEQIRLVRDPFFKDYAAKYNGREPFVNPSTNGSWHWGSGFPNLIDEAVANKTLFMNWWNTVALPPNKETCSESIFIYTFSNYQPAYRSTYTGSVISTPEGIPGVLLGLNTGFISPMAGNPDFVVPVGQVKYQSVITQHEEVLPVSVRIMAARGCDLMLLDLINELVEAGIVPQVKTGDSLDGGPIYI